MAEKEGRQIVQIETTNIKTSSRHVTVKLDVGSDEGMRQQMAGCLEEYSTKALEAMLDGKPVMERLGLRFIRDNRDGNSELLAEDQVRHHIGLIVNDRRRTEAARKPWHEQPNGKVFLAVIAILIGGLILYKLGWD